MSLVVDRREELKGKPGVHAIVIGVSDYPNLPKEGQAPTPESFGMRPLTSTCLSAFRMQEWLTAHADSLPLPLVTCRVLVSPCQDELATEPGFGALKERAQLDPVLEALSEWREDAKSHAENTTLFYFAGHGVQRSKGDAVLLLEGFGNKAGGALRNAIDVNSVFNGMAPSPKMPDIARMQLYFIDACRNLPSAFKDFDTMNTTPAFDAELAGIDNRSAPIFYAAVPGAKAQALKGEQTLFNKALLACLSNDAADFEDVEGRERWCISVHSLDRALTRKMEELNAQFAAEQDYIMSGLVADKPIIYLDAAPKVHVTLAVEPAGALDFTQIEVKDDTGASLHVLEPPLKPHPFELELPAGFYTIGAKITPPHEPYKDLPGRVRPVTPPHLRWFATVEK